MYVSIDTRIGPRFRTYKDNEHTLSGFTLMPTLTCGASVYDFVRFNDNGEPVYRLRLEEE